MCGGEWLTMGYGKMQSERLWNPMDLGFKFRVYDLLALLALENLLNLIRVWFLFFKL